MWRWSCRRESWLFNQHSILHVCGGDPTFKLVFIFWVTVFSTYVEVILIKYAILRGWCSILHVCGGDPRITCSLCISITYSPRMWRWSYLAAALRLNIFVFSTYVEVILPKNPFLGVGACILHVCGGDPAPRPNHFTVTGYSPRMWRWSLSQRRFQVRRLVFSTYVEVILIAGWNLKYPTRILHVCGGDPGGVVKSTGSLLYSPRMWRWSPQAQPNQPIAQVFSTYVEVIPFCQFYRDDTGCILHVCGGDPNSSRLSS